MVRVSIKPKQIVIKGHAMYDDYGKDIVCASVSSIVTTTVNAILMFDKKTIRYVVKEGLVKIDILEKNDNTVKLLNNMVNLLSELARDYPENIKVERE